MLETWDAVVVGAGPAGCAAAYDLQAAGRRVLLLDRAEFPRAKACAGGLTMKAVRALRFPIHPVVRLWVNGLNLESGPDERVRLGRSAPVCAMTVREELDAFCLQKTRERGALFERVGQLLAVETQTEAVLLCFEDGRKVRSRYLIGADGVHSRVRALTSGAGWFRTAFALEANVPYRSGDAPPLTFDFAPVQRGYGWLFPRNDHVNVGLYVDGEEKIDREALGLYIDRRCGTGYERSRTVGQFLGLGAAAYKPDESSRILLAGDAAGFVDPLTGEGIYGAIRSGQVAAAAVHTALAQRAKLPEAYRKEAWALQRDLAVAEHAAERFYAEPARGWRLLHMPLLPRFVVRAYSDGVPLRHVLRIARAVGRLRAALGSSA